MSYLVESGTDALVMDKGDHVATALRDIEVGETVHYQIEGERYELTLLDSAISRPINGEETLCNR